MKKILMAGALAASMLASSAAFAADLTVGVSEDKLTVTADTDAIMAANAGKQMTVVVVDGDGTTVSTDTIRYIDQDEAKADLFESMGVLLRATKEVDAEGNPIMETALPDGTYTVKIGGDDITDLFVGTLTVTSTPEGPTYTLGDVEADGKVNISDVLAVLNAYLGNLTLTDTQKLSADVEPKGAVDGKINISDVLLILNVYLGNDSF